MRTISKDISEVGLQNLIKTAYDGNLLNIKFLPRKRENFNRAEITVGTMKEARLLVDSLERNQNFQLSPQIEEESDSSVSSKASPLPQSETKPKTAGPPLVDPGQKQQLPEPEEVFTFNKPFLAARASLTRGQGVEQSSTAIPGIKRPEVDSTDRGEDQRKEEIINRPAVLDDENFRLSFMAKEEQKKSLAETIKVSEVAACRSEEVPSDEVRVADLSSEDSEPPFYKNDLDTDTDSDPDTEDRRDVPLKCSSTDVQVPEHRPLGGEQLERKTGSVEPVKPGVVEEKSPNLASLGLKDEKMEVVGEEMTKISREHASSAPGGLTEERKTTGLCQSDENQNIPGKEDDDKLPETWTPAKIAEVFAEEATDPELPVLLIRTAKDLYFDAKLDPGAFELTAVLDQTLCKKFKKQLRGDIFVKRVGWIQEKSLNVVELKKQVDGFEVDLGAELCRLRLLRRKTEQCEAAGQVVLEEGTPVYWRGFGKLSCLAKLLICREEDRQLVEAAMSGTDSSQTLDPELGQTVAVPNTDQEDRALKPFLRAKILKVRDGRVLCELLDNHGRQVCTLEDLHPLPPAVRKIPPLACEVTLHGVPARPRAEAEVKLEPFRQMILQGQFWVKIFSPEEKVVQLVGPAGDSFNDILSEILEGQNEDLTTQVEVETKEVQTKAKVMTIPEKKKSDKKVEEKEVKTKVKVVKKTDEEVEVKKNPESSSVDDLNVELLTSYHCLALGEKITVRVLHFTSWSNLFVCAEADYPQLVKFQVRSPLASVINC